MSLSVCLSVCNSAICKIHDSHPWKSSMIVIYESHPWKSSMKVIHESHPWKSSMRVIHDSQIATVSHFQLDFFWRIPLLIILLNNQKSFMKQNVLRIIFYPSKCQICKMFLNHHFLRTFCRFDDKCCWFWNIYNSFFDWKIDW